VRNGDQRDAGETLTQLIVVLDSQDLDSRELAAAIERLRQTAWSTTICTAAWQTADGVH
jgi:hypothetical protein